MKNGLVRKCAYAAVGMAATLAMMAPGVAVASEGTSATPDHHTTVSSSSSHVWGLGVKDGSKNAGIRGRLQAIKAGHAEVMSRFRHAQADRPSDGDVADCSASSSEGEDGGLAWTVAKTGDDCVLTIDGASPAASGSTSDHPFHVKATWTDYVDAITKVVVRSIPSNVDISDQADQFGNESGLFSELHAATDITGLDNIDTHAVGSVDGLFSYDYAVKNLDLSGFDTSHITSMVAMFADDYALEKVDVSRFDTSKVTNMSGMFADDYALENFNVSGFDTSKVTNMSGMFSGNYAMAHVDVSGFDTSNVTDMKMMFSEDSALTELDLGGFDTSKVTTMNMMFSEDSALKSITFGEHFDTSKVTDMNGMFSDSDLASLDVSGFDTSKVTDMGGMFAGNAPLKNLDVSRFDTGNVMDMSVMFSDDTALAALNLSGFDTSKVTTMYMMVSHDPALTDLDLSGFDTSKVTDMCNMFSADSALKSITFGTRFDTSKVTNMSGMFAENTALTDLDLSGFDTSKVTVMSGMFSGDTALTDLDLSGFDTKSVTAMDDMFANDIALKRLDLGSFDMGAAADLYEMFADDTALETINLGPKTYVAEGADQTDTFKGLDASALWRQSVPKGDWKGAFPELFGSEPATAARLASNTPLRNTSTSYTSLPESDPNPNPNPGQEPGGTPITPVTPSVPGQSDTVTDPGKSPASSTSANADSSKRHLAMTGGEVALLMAAVVALAVAGCMVMRMRRRNMHGSPSLRHAFGHDA